MKRIVRSIINVPDKNGYASIPEEELIRNYAVLRDSGFEFNTEEDQKILEWVTSYFYRYTEIPNLNSTLDFFEANQEQAVVDRVEDVKHTNPYMKADFENLLRDLVSKQKDLKCRDILHTAAEILHQGVTISAGKSKTFKKGMRDALTFVMSESDKLLSPELGNTRLRGDVRDDRQELEQNYNRIKTDPTYGYGRLCGLTGVDVACRGNKRGHLWIHAAWTGELKTTFAINWAYNNCTRYGWNSYYLSLEMPYEQIRNMIWCLHSANRKFLNEGHEPISYTRLRDGELTPREEDYFFNVVCPDFENNPEYGSFYVERPVDDITVPEIKSRMEMLHQQMPIHLAFIDHAGLVTPTIRNSDYTIALNSVVRDTKKMALNFNRGEGIPLVLLFQVNRKGKLDADKNEGRYKMQDLSYANEAERSADVITTTYLNDEYKENAEVLFGCLKTRDNEPFKSFRAKIMWSCRRLYHLNIQDLKEHSDEIQMDLSEFLG